MLRSGRFLLLSLLAIVFIIIYGSLDPATTVLFPKCPFLSLTGYQCAGCGSQRAIHQLLQGNIAGAFHYNPLFVITLPYLFLGVLFEFPSLKNKYLRTQRILFGYQTIYLILAIIISFWILRNIIPMGLL